MADFVGFLKKVAPWIGAAATGNVPALITMAAQTVGAVIGKNVDSSANAIAAAVAGATPDQLIAMKQADNDFALKMQAAGFQYAEDILKLQLEDVANARNFQIQTRSWVAPAVATVFVVGFFVISGLKMGGMIHTDDQTLNDLITTLRDGLMLILAYYFGSSAGSAAKDETINKQAGK